MLQAATKRARTIADKHREARARRAELRSLQNGEDVQVGYFKAGVNRGANLLRQAMNALHRGVGTDDVSGDPLKGEMVLAARKLELEFFEKMGVYTRVTRAEAHASGKGKIIQGRWIDVNKGSSEIPDYRSRYSIYSRFCLQYTYHIFCIDPASCTLPLLHF